MFTSTGGQHGGQEVTALTTMPFFIHSKHSTPRMTQADKVVGSK
jgi:hypothetical protein